MVSQTCLVLNDLDSSAEAWWGLLQTVPQLAFGVFLMIRLSVGLGRKTIPIMSHQGHSTSARPALMMLIFSAWRGVCAWGFSAAPPLFPTIRCCSPWKEVTVSAGTYEWGLMLPFLDGECLTKLCGILLYGVFVHFPTRIYSIIYSHQYGLMGIYFMLWVIIQYCIIYCVVHIIPASFGTYSFDRFIFIRNKWDN